MDFDLLRKNMVEQQLIARGDITDGNVIKAFLKVPRHEFVPDRECAPRGGQAGAYGDFPLPIGCGQTISQPYMVALMTQCLKLKKSDKVLEIGTGSGYQSAILAEIAKEVYTIERFDELSAKAKGVLSGLGYKNIYFKVGDGTLGWNEKALFDAIIVTAGAPKASESLLGQLAEGGRLVIPIGERIAQTLVVFKKGSGTFFERREVCGCMFVPLVGEEGWIE